MKVRAGRQAAYQEWKNVNDDPYGAGIFRYAERWADLMEAAIDEGQDIADCAKATSLEADTDGITGFMYGASVKILASCWEHGEALRRWHNLDVQIGNEGEAANREGGVLNPAVLCLGG